MAKIVYNEFYGELSYAERAAIRKFNVPPASHESIIRRIGTNDHGAVTEAIRAGSGSGSFSWHDFCQWQEDREDAAEAALNAGYLASMIRNTRRA